MSEQKNKFSNMPYYKPDDKPSDVEYGEVSENNIDIIDDEVNNNDIIDDEVNTNPSIDEKSISSGDQNTSKINANNVNTDNIIKETDTSAQNAINRINNELRKVKLPPESILETSKSPSTLSTLESGLNNLFNTLEDNGLSRGSIGVNQNSPSLSDFSGVNDEGCVYITLGQILGLDYITTPSFDILLEAFNTALPLIKKWLPCLVTIIRVITIILSIINLLIQIFQLIMSLKPIIERIRKILSCIFKKINCPELALDIGLAISSIIMFAIIKIPLLLLQPILNKRILVVCPNDIKAVC